MFLHESRDEATATMNHLLLLTTNAHTMCTGGMVDQRFKTKLKIDIIRLKECKTSKLISTLGSNWIEQCGATA